MMASPLLKLSVALLRNLAESIDSGRLLPPFTPLSLQRYVSVNESTGVAEELSVLSEDGMHVSQLGCVLRLIADSKTVSSELADGVQLVWSGPEMPGAASRDTSVVVRELFSTTQSSVLVAGFSISRGHEIFRALAHRMLLTPALRVRMFLNVARETGDQSSNEEVLNSFYRSFKSNHWPWEKFPQVFYDPRALETVPSMRAALHAKCIVVDRLRCFVSSANFTESGQARNIEVGILVDSGNLAISIHDQFESLVTQGILRGVPGLS
jgi:phosphatidylserine/phosphatidylglycerophosphate/cardiolipin synthase-like enzyme